jgi:apolipoprotein N-acyltransferase
MACAFTGRSAVNYGVSIIVDPYGRIDAESGVNERTVVVGDVFTVSGRALYTRLGDWFGWLMVVGLAAMVGVVILGKRGSDKSRQ